MVFPPTSFFKFFYVLFAVNRSSFIWHLRKHFKFCSSLHFILLVGAVPQWSCQHSNKEQSPAVKRYFESAPLYSMRSPTLVVFDKEGRMQDITETLSMKGESGVVFGWVLPLRPRDEVWNFQEELEMICDNGKTEKQSQWIEVKPQSTQAISLRDFTPDFCQGIYNFSVIIQEQQVLQFRLRVN